MINIISSSRYQINRSQIKEQAKKYLDKVAITEDKTVNIVFVGKNKMKQISLQYKKENVALPVLTFSYRENKDPGNVFGEILLCYPQIVLLAAERNRKVDEMIIKMIDHGIKNLLA